MRVLPVLLLALAAQAGAATPRTTAELLAAAPASDWRTLDGRHALVMELPAGRVLVELAADLVPAHFANIRTLVNARYFDGLAVVRLQDNYVAQWGDPEGKRSLGEAKKSLAPEFTFPIASTRGFTALPDRDTYAPEAGFVGGFPVARDPQAGRAWMVHCYGMVGAGRENDEDSGNGAELYAVIGNAPRLLDRNVTLVGRVIRGMALLSALKRGTQGPLSFYERAEDRTPILRTRFFDEARDGPAPEILRTDSATFRALVEMRRHRRDDWYKHPAGAVDVCNVPVPVRDRPAAASPPSPK